MKTCRSMIVITLVLSLAGLCAHGQTPDRINYQGRLVSNTNLYSGDVGLTIRLYNEEWAGTSQYEDSNTVAVVDGLYSTFVGDDTVSGTLDGALTNAEVWLEVEANGVVLLPRERVVAVCYARRAAGVDDGAITEAMLAVGAITSNNIAQEAVTSQGIMDGDIQFADLGQNGALPGQVMMWNGASWTSATAEASLLGYDENGTFVTRPVAAGADALALGVGARAEATYGTVGGGMTNIVRAAATGGTVGGGMFNSVGDASPYGTVAGGWANDISHSEGGAIAGGAGHIIDGSEYAAIGGGYYNWAQSGAVYAVIGGGYRNTAATDAEGAAIGGGLYNVANVGSWWGTIGGGFSNAVGGGASGITISGGQQNRTEAGASYATIAGGLYNAIEPDATGGAIGGGERNIVQTNATHGTIAGGQNNTIDEAYATVGGGEGNTAGAAYSGIGSGQGNSVGQGSVVAGIFAGAGNAVRGSAEYAFIGGGLLNDNDASDFAVIGGGDGNVLQAADYAVIGGGRSNIIASSSTHATINGGEQNTIGTNSPRSTVGGGSQHEVLSSPSATIGGGIMNIIEEGSEAATIAGGWNNMVYSNAAHAAIPGGWCNRAAGAHAFAAGTAAMAMHGGTFVWSDVDWMDPPFSSTDTNQFLIRARNGVGINTNDPRAALHVNGQAVIGGTPRAPAFGMEVVLRQSGDGTGVLFQHPGADVALHWDPATRVLMATNGGAGGYYDVTMRFSREGTPTAEWLTLDMTGGSTASLTNDMATTAGWHVFMVREDQRGPGFKFDGCGYNDGISGLVTYWE